ncbi:MAG: helicase-related protein [bacterium]|nr:helicase-related protein [bacterium]
MARNRRDTRTGDLLVWAAVRDAPPAGWVPPVFRMLDSTLIDVRPFAEIVFDAWKRYRRFGVIAATGSGKTGLAYMLADDPLANGSHVIVSAPTIVLAQQHAAFAQKVFRLPATDVCFVDGGWKPERRAKFWATSRLCFATPQTMANDIARGIVPLDTTGLIVIDECHHAAKTHASIAIAAAGAERDIRLVAFTASPGSTCTRVERLRKNLQLQEWVDIADDETSAFRPPVRRSVRIAELDANVHAIIRSIEDVLERVTRILVGHRLLQDVQRVPSLKVLKDAAATHKQRLRTARDKATRKTLKDLQAYLTVAFQLVTILTSIVSDDYAVALQRLERACTKQWKLGNGKPGGLTGSAKRLTITPEVQHARAFLAQLAQAAVVHPKQQTLLDVIREAREAGPVRGLVFNRYAEGCKRLVELLNTTFGAGTAVAVLGKKHMKPADAIAALHMLADGTVSFAVATDVAREGVHIPAIDLLVLYTPPRNERELIQLEGRTGRTKPGVIVGITADHSTDQRYAVIARAAAARMHTLFTRRTARAAAGDGVQRSHFSRTPEKQPGTFVEELREGFVFERFRVDDACVMRPTTSRPYVRLTLADRTGTLPCFHWCPDGLTQAETLVSTLPRATVVIAAGIVEQGDGTRRIIINPAEGQHLVRCPDTDYTVHDYVATTPF